MSKLELNQPFLLYKAYNKLELTAYLLDPKNQLNEKSGDPIYFPHNYPGKCVAPDASLTAVITSLGKRPKLSTLLQLFYVPVLPTKSVAFTPSVLYVASLVSFIE